MDELIKVESVSKKFCFGLKRSMLYGVSDIIKNSFGISTNSEKLRKNEFRAVEDISFSMKRGESLGIIGPNGSGKSTLLKMLNGIYWPDAGKITVVGRVGALIEVGAGFHPMLTGRENIYINGAILGMSGDEINKKFSSIVEFSGIGEFLDTPVKKYSSGMYVRLGFSVAIHSDPDILLIDEILAVGDSGFQTKCFNRIGDLKKKGTATILVSHNMHIISAFSDRVILFKKGKGKLYDNLSEGINEYYNLFEDQDNSGFEKICNGNEKIEFSNVVVNKNTFLPGENFIINMNYNSTIDYNKVEIDTAIYSNRERGLYFQASNKAFKKDVDLKHGNHNLQIRIEQIPIHNTKAKIVVAIWSKERTELLFWWKIPAEFKGIPFASGKNFINVSYHIKK